MGNKSSKSAKAPAKAEAKTVVPSASSGTLPEHPSQREWEAQIVAQQENAAWQTALESQQTKAKFDTLALRTRDSETSLPTVNSKEYYTPATTAEPVAKEEPAATGAELEPAKAEEPPQAAPAPAPAATEPEPEPVKAEEPTQAEPAPTPAPAPAAAEPEPAPEPEPVKTEEPPQVESAPTAAEPEPAAASVDAASGLEGRVIFVLGGPGCGKGTACATLAPEFNLAHVSVGECLRQAVADGLPEAELIQKHMDEGTIVPLDVTLSVLKKTLDAQTNKAGFLVDGFPRSLEQATDFEARVVKGKMTLAFVCDESVMLDRLRERAKTSGRADDNEETQAKRLVTYRETTVPVLDYFRQAGTLREVDASLSIPEVAAAARQHLLDAGFVPQQQ